MSSEMQSIYISFLNRLDIEALNIQDDEILAAVELGLRMQGEGKTVIHPRMHLEPGIANGHFNVLRGYIGGNIGMAGVKIVGDFVDNYKRGLPSELATLQLFDPETGIPQAIIDAAGITDMRTGAISALGAKYLAPSNPRILCHIGARGTAYWNVRLMDRLFDFEEIRVHSRRPESRQSFAARLEQDLGKKITVTDDWESAVVGADIVVEASRLNQPTPLLKTGWIKKGALVMPYGTMSAVELDLLDIMDKVVMDDWGQAKAGQFGALREHVKTGRLTEETLHAELGEIVVGSKPGRESDDETIIFWHRGLSLSDIALGHAMLKKGEKLGIGQKLRFA
ncbi:ornithine cyclodeaminase family protein [Komagataeibacter swingsii]|nr:ornithine cyclodeaminase family protein [Komagataeibacter swingsii]